MAHIFISYKHEDADFAAMLIQQVEAAGFIAWIDRERLRAGEDWRLAIDRAIRESFALIVIMTPAAKQSEYVTYEWACALGMGVRIIPILLQRTPLHPRLEVLQYLDFSDYQRRPWDQLLKLLSDTERDYMPPALTDTLNAPPIVRELIRSLESSIADERRSAIQKLSRINHRAARAALTEVIILRDPDWQVRLTGVEALANMAEKGQAPQSIVLLLQDTVSYVREAAARTLGTIGDPQCVPDLLQAWRDENHRQQHSDRLDYVLDAIRDALLSFGAGAEAPLLEIFRERENPLRWTACSWLTQLGSTRLMQELVYELAEAEKADRLRALEALTQLETVAALPEIIACLEDRDPEIRERAAYVLGKVGDAALVAPLTDALRDRSPDVRSAAVRALGEIGSPTAIPVLVDVMDRAMAAASTEDPYYLEAAAESLIAVGSAQVIPFMVTLWQNYQDHALAFVPLYVIAHLRDSGALAALLERLPGADGHKRTVLVWALASIAHPSLLPTFETLAADADETVRCLALLGMWKTGTPDALRAFTAAAMREPLTQSLLVPLLRDTVPGDGLLDLLRVLAADPAPLPPTVAPYNPERLLACVSTLSDLVSDGFATTTLGGAGEIAMYHVQQVALGLAAILDLSLYQSERVQYDTHRVVTALARLENPGGDVPSQTPKASVNTCVNAALAWSGEETASVLHLLAEDPGFLELVARWVTSGEVLAQGLGESRTMVRAVCAFIMGKRREVHPALINALRDEALLVRQAAATSLELARWKPILPDDRAALAAASLNFDQCVRIGAPVLPYLLPLLSHDDDAVREEAAQALAEIGESQALEALLHAAALPANDSIHGTLQEAIIACRFDLERHAPVFLRSSVPAVRADMLSRMLLHPLPPHQVPALLPLVLPCLQDTDGRVRALAAMILGTWQAVEAVPVLVAQVLAEPDAEARYMMAVALHTLDAGAASPLFTALLRDPSRDVRQFAASTLVDDAYAAQWDTYPPETRIPVLIAMESWDGLDDFGAQAVPYLLPHLDDAHLEIIQEVAGVLHRIGDRSVVPQLAACLEKHLMPRRFTPQPRRGRFTLDSILKRDADNDRFGFEDDFATFSDEFDSDAPRRRRTHGNIAEAPPSPYERRIRDTGTREMVCEALLDALAEVTGEPPEAAHPVLLTAFQDLSEDVRLAALEALCQRPDARPAVRNALQDPSMRVCLLAVRELGAMRDVESVDALTSLLLEIGAEALPPPLPAPGLPPLETRAASDDDFDLGDDIFGSDDFSD